jgi:hypothetical protein
MQASSFSRASASFTLIQPLRVRRAACIRRSGASSHGDDGEAALRRLHRHAYGQFLAALRRPSKPAAAVGSAPSMKIAFGDRSVVARIFNDLPRPGYDRRLELQADVMPRNV